MLLKDIVSLTLTLGWKNKKQPIGSTELDLEAGNLVKFQVHITLVPFFMFPNIQHWPFTSFDQ